VRFRLWNRRFVLLGAEAIREVGVRMREVERSFLDLQRELEDVLPEPL
jgi:hypothetical protein